VVENMVVQNFVVTFYYCNIVWHLLYRIYTLKSQKEKLEAEVKRQIQSIIEQKNYIEEQM
jgi:SNF family Na+-dependent transporter